MKVVTICIPESYIEGLDRLIDQSKYPNRSEIIRIAIRDLLVDELWGQRKKEDDVPLILQLERLTNPPHATLDIDTH
ncbi:MAG: type II toxin-antitoxin system ParD family antitoxin [Candidatus Thorarchaeota archaeon]|nr:MAG: type II toxin-antitoxin system ParD family antitoxin [Candidatus Thorarchaeota archaeon]